VVPELGVMSITSGRAVGSGILATGSWTEVGDSSGPEAPGVISMT
jgi:hypothetical protein